MTLCQAEVTYRTNRFGEQMTDDQIEDMKVGFPKTKFIFEYLFGFVDLYFFLKKIY